MTRATRIAWAGAGAFVLLGLGGTAGAEHGTPGTAQLVSRASGLTPVPAATTNNSFLGENLAGDLFSASAGRTISGDGNRVVFASDADGLSSHDDNRFRNIFVRDRSDQTTTLVSRGDGLSGAAANGDSFEPSISQDGTTVAFTTHASNLGDSAPNTTNPKVYVRTIATGVNKLASRATGTTGSAQFLPGQPSLDEHGAKVAFSTFSSLDVADTGTFDRDVYVRTLATDTTTYVSRADGVAGAEGDAESRSPSISGNGTRVAFESVATNLIGTGNDTNGRRDIFVRDLAAGTTVIASRATTAAGALGNQDSTNPSLTFDGTKVAFSSSATNLDVDATAGTNVFVRDLAGSTTSLASRKDGVGGAQANVANLFSPPAISSDGTAVVFMSGGTNEPPFVTTFFGIYVRTLATGTTRLVTRPDGTYVAPDGPAASPSLSADGKLVVFDSTARNLGTDADPEFRGIYLRDLTSNTTTSIVRPGFDNVPFANSGLDSSDGTPAGVSSDGRYVLFTSRADWISSEDDNAVSNVFVRDLVTDATTLVSRASGSSGAPADGASIAGGISADGTKAVFVSAGTNLNPGHTSAEVYVRNLTTNQTVQVSPLDSNTAGGETLDGVTRARISADGTKVVFQTTAPIDPADSGFTQDAYVVNADGTGAPVWMNRSSTGVAGNGESYADAISADGSRVVFDSSSSNIDPADNDPAGPDVYVRDLGTNQTILVSRANGAAGDAGNSESRGGGISADGNRVAFSSFAANLVPGVVNAGQIYVRDIAAATTLLASRDDGPTGIETAGNPQAQPAISADGQRVAFAHTGSINGIPNPGSSPPFQVYVRDLGTNLTTLVSHAAGNASSVADRSAQHAAISGNGDCVAFQSAASDIVPAFPGGSDFGNVYVATVARECPAVPPETSIASGPSGTIRNRTPVFTFTSNDGGATFECRLDGAAFTACATPFTAPAQADGPHTFFVRAVDPATHRDASPASRTFAVDATPPDTSLASGPSGTVADRAATFTFSATETATFACSLDGGAAVACTSPASYDGLADGSHTFAVGATDALGNSDASPATRTWAVDKTGPAASVEVPKQKLGTALAKGFRIQVRTNEAASFKLVVRFGTKVFGRRSGKLVSGVKKTFVLKPSKAVKRALAKKRLVTLTIRLELRDALGNAARPRTRTIRLRR